MTEVLFAKQEVTMAAMFAYTHAICRGVPSNFVEALAQEAPEQPVDIQQALKEHEQYEDLIKSLVPNFHVVPADNSCADCVFIEDCAVIVPDSSGPGAIAVITRPGAESRRPEVGPVKDYLLSIGFQEDDQHSTQITPTASSNPLQLRQLTDPATLDGGDVMFTGKSLWVGITKRTNKQAVEQFANLVPYPVHGMEVSPGPALHLKSLVTMIAEDTIIIADTPQSKQLAEMAKAMPGAMDGLHLLWVPNMLTANVLRIGQTVVCQGLHQESVDLIRKFCQSKNLTLHVLHMSEFAKVDGALTCCSLLFRR